MDNSSMLKSILSKAGEVYSFLLLPPTLEAARASKSSLKPVPTIAKKSLRRKKKAPIKFSQANNGWAVAENQKKGIYCATKIMNLDEIETIESPPKPSVTENPTDRILALEREIAELKRLAATQSFSVQPDNLSTPVSNTQTRSTLNFSSLLTPSSNSPADVSHPIPAPNFETPEFTFVPKMKAANQISPTSSIPSPSQISLTPPTALPNPIIPDPVSEPPTTVPLASIPMPPPLPPPAPMLPPPLPIAAIKENDNEPRSAKPLKRVRSNILRTQSLTDLINSGKSSQILKKAPVQRSPGGTPIKSSTNESESFFAKALRLKFQNASSPTSPLARNTPLDKENSNSPFVPRNKLTEIITQTPRVPSDNIVSDSEWESSPASSPLRV